MMDYVQTRRLADELEFITAHRDRWEQQMWAEVRNATDVESAEEAACNTVGCLAGNACVHNGRVEFNSNVFGNTKYWYVDVVDANGRRSDWRREARKLFGLTNRQASLLFDGGNTLWQLWKLAEVFSFGMIEVPPFVSSRVSRVEAEALLMRMYIRASWDGDYDEYEDD